MTETAHESAPPTAPPAATEALEASRALPFRFTGSASEYFRIWIVNVALSIVTLGIYSAWAKVRNKQYFYRHTWLDDSSFEYTADPRKILKGRILAATALGLLAFSREFSVLLYAICFLLLVLASPWVLVKALGFNARNSTWRNVRFAFHGTAGQAASEYFKALGIVLLTLGIGSGYMQYRLTRFAATNHSFGKVPFRFTTPPVEYVFAYLIAFLLYTGASVGLVGGTTAVALIVGDAGGSLAIAMMVVAVGFCYLLVFSFLKARLANLAWGGLAVGDHRFTSTQRFIDVFGLEFTNLLAMVCTLGLALPWARVRNHRYRLAHLTFLAAGPLVVEADPAQPDDGATGDALGDLGDFDVGFG